MARIIPVIDVMGGRVVRAVGGRRHGYRPVESRLTTSTDPAEVARVLLDATRATELYVADLDAAETGKVSDRTRELVGAAPAVVFLDAGARDYEDLALLPKAANLRPVVASETSLYFPRRPPGPGDLPPNFVYSLDLKNGQLLDACAVEYGFQDSAAELAGWAWSEGARSLIVLDIGVVGTGAGPATAVICREIRARWPEAELITGGGVRSWDDVKRLEDAGADGVLVASALHDGTLHFPRP